MNKKKRPLQKLVSFTDTGPDYERVKQDLLEGWSITSLVKNGSFFVGIMEFHKEAICEKDSVYIPPRKKIKITAS